jgi:PilZ domain
VLIFKRIFNFEKTKVAQLEKRLNRRYVPGTGFPLRTSLHFAGRNCPAVLQDMSGNGVAVLVGKAVALDPGQMVRLDLELDQHRLEIDTRLAHLQPHDQGFYCGLGLKFGEFQSQQAYLQLLQPVVIGQSLQTMSDHQPVQPEPGFRKQIFIGESDSMLTVTTALANGPALHSFEFRMSDFFCQGSLQTGQLETGTQDPDAAPEALVRNPVFATSGGLHAEIHQIFRWILPNLSAAVPADVRAFLQQFAG